MPLHVLLDAQPPLGYGGKVVDLYTEFADMVVRFGRGIHPLQVHHELGHYTQQGHQRLSLMVLPGAILHERTTCALSAAVRLDPEQCIQELDVLSARGANVSPQQLLLDAHQPIVMPYHHMMRRFGVKAVCVEDVLLEDLSNKDALAQKLQRLLPEVNALLALHDGPRLSREHCMIQAVAWGARLGPFQADVPARVQHVLRKGRHVVLEGPSWVGEATHAAHASLELGIAPSQCTRVIGMTRAYAVTTPEDTSRTLGPADELARVHLAQRDERLAQQTFGWLDVPALRRCVQVNGLTGVALTHLDVLSGLKQVRLLVKAATLDAPAVYETLVGWGEPLDECRHVRELPSAAQRFVSRLEGLLDVPLVMLSVGPNRAETIVLKRLHR